VLSSTHLGIAEQDDADDLFADGGAELGDGGGSESGALAVAAGDDLGAGALAVGELEEVGHLGDGGAAGALGEGVVTERRGVPAADALDPDVGPAERGLEVVADVGAEGALCTQR